MAGAFVRSTGPVTRRLVDTMPGAVHAGATTASLAVPLGAKMRQALDGPSNRRAQRGMIRLVSRIEGRNPALVAMLWCRCGFGANQAIKSTIPPVARAMA